MTKFKNLTNIVLKEILKAKNLDTSGNKSEMVLRLSEHFKSDEMDENEINEIVPNDSNIQMQIDGLKTMMDTLLRTMTELQRTTDSQRAAESQRVTEIQRAAADQRVADSQRVAANQRTAEIQRVVENQNNVEVQQSTFATNNNLIDMDTSIVQVSDVMRSSSAAEERTRFRIPDIIAILPQFDPKQGTITSKQFIAKIESLKAVYGWPNEIVLYAVQAKLAGHAKTWADAQDVFHTWNEFADAFIADFPCETSMADEHIALANTRQHKNESTMDFYYKMLSKGRRAKIDEKSIIRHIINGLLDEHIKRTCNASQFYRCTDLLQALNEMTTTSQRSGDAENVRNQTKPTTSGYRVDNKRSYQNDGFVCYNCGESGHISRNCTKPQKRTRCTRCDKVHRRGQIKCEESSVRRVEAQENVQNIFERQVNIAGVRCSAYIDTGSECHLIRESCVQKLQLETKYCSMDLSGLWGGTCRVTQKIEAQIEVDDLNIEDVLYVVSDNVLTTDVLLGRSLFDKSCVEVKVDAHGLQFIERANVMRTTVIPEEKKMNNENINTPHVNSSTKDEMDQLILEYKDIFASGLENVGKTDLVEMQIELTDNDVAIAHKPYRVPEPKKEDVRNMINEMLKFDIIEESTSQYASPMILVKKKNGSDRLCVDYRMLNKYTRKEIFPTPNIEELMHQATKFKYYSSLDLNSGYYQIPIATSSRKFTAFITIDGLYQFKRMPFGLMNAPAVFQRLMAKIHNQLPAHDIISYMDDILIGSNTENEMLDKLQRIFAVLRENKLTLNLAKCSFMTNAVQFLGHQLCSGGVKPGELKTKAINDYPRPTNVTEVRRFLGLSGYFRKFIPGYAIITEPLRILLKKDKLFTWDASQENAFKTVKTLLTSEPILTGYDVAAEQEIHTDASSIGLAAVLLQRTGTEMKPVAYYSRSTTENESKFHGYELEALAVVDALERFRFYVYGKKIKVITDCNAVTTLMEKKDVLPRIARWWLKVQDYDVEFEHRAGQRMPHVDALSRAPSEVPREIDVATMRIAKTTITNEDWLYSMQIQDDKLKAIIHAHEHNDSEIIKDYHVENGRLFRKIKEKKIWVVPKGLRWRIVHDSHDRVGHLGVEKTIERVTSNFWFPRLRNFVKSYVKSCLECAYNKGKGIHSGIEYHYDEIQSIPFKIVHMDHLGPFPISSKRNQHVLVIIDSFTKYVIIKAVKNTSTKFVTEAMNELISYVGPPEMLVTDRGTAYTSNEFQRFCTNYDIKHRLNAVRTPRANGQVERTNRTILSMLTTSTENDKNWDEKLKDIQWSLNTMKNSVTGFTPQELLFNFTPRDTLKNKLILALHDDRVATQEEMQTKRDVAAKRINDNRAKVKIKFDGKHKRAKPYEVGALVLAENEIPSIGHSRKLEPQFKGPFMVTKVLGNDRYVIEDLPKSRRTKRKYSFVYAADKLKPWCELFDEDDDEADHDMTDGDDLVDTVDEVAQE